MSLTSFVSQREVKERLSKEYELPAIKCVGQLRVQLRTNKYSLVGTAFDYLMRFWIKRNNPQAEAKSWIAETSVEVTLPMLGVSKSVTKKLREFWKKQSKLT